MTTGFWSIILPEATENLVTNPSVEVDTTNYGASGSASLVRATTQQRFGVASLQITPTAATSDGANFAVSLTTGITYTFSVWVKGVLGVPYRIFFATTGGSVLGTPTEFVGTGEWQFVAVTRAETATNVRRVHLEKNNSASTGVFHTDAWQCEAKGYATTYCDGDQPGCRWTGLPHGSTSLRDGQFRGGGREVNLDDLSIKVQQAFGIGMPPAKHLVQNLVEESKFRGRKVLPRTIQLNADALGSSRLNLHALRKELVAALSPDLVAPDQEFTIRYYGAGEAVEFRGVYDSGLEFNPPDGFTETFPLRFICYDPYAYGIGNAAASLATSQSVANANRIVARIEGVWQALSTGMNGKVRAIAIGPDGLVYAGGDFTTAGGTAISRIAVWDGVAWAALGTGAADGAVYALVIGTDGSLYAAGSFTGMGGVTNTARIAKWSGGAWSALGSGAADSTVAALTIGLDGLLYAGGGFSQMGGVTNTSRVAKWNGTAWSALGTGANAFVWALAIGPDGTLYAGGDLTSAGGVPAEKIAQWDGTAWSALGTGMSAVVVTLAIGPDGLLYAGGDFHTAGGVVVRRIAKWNGTAWSALGQGISAFADQMPSTLAFDPEGILHIGGSFVGSTIDHKLLIWNGYTYGHYEIDLGASPGVERIVISGHDIYIGFTSAATAISAVTTTVTNAGSRTSGPEISFKRTGGSLAQVVCLRNQTTGKTIWLDYALLDGETLTLDFVEKTIISSFFGSVPRAVLRNSDFGSLALGRGQNEIVIFVKESGSPTIAAFAQWQLVYWSADGVA